MTSDRQAVFSSPLLVDRIPDQGTSGRIVVQEDERQAMAKIMDVQAVHGLAFDFEVKPIGKGRYRVKGRLEASVTQTCVVTLEPLDRQVVEDVDLEFWPETELASLSETDLEKTFDPDRDDPEAIRDGVIDLGVVAYETLATGLDPYPRKPDAAFEWNGDEMSGEEAPDPGPFDVLRTLKPD